MNARSFVFATLVGLLLIACSGSAQDPERTGKAPADPRLPNAPADISTGKAPADPRLPNAPADTSTGKAPADPRAGKAPAEPRAGEAPAAEASIKQPPFFAGLVVLKADWKNTPNAQAIEQDLRAAFGVDDAVGPEMLFSRTDAAFFTPEKFEQLTTWLMEHDLIKSHVSFTPPQPNVGPDGALHDSDLSYNLSLLSVPEAGQGENEAPQQWNWTLGNVQDGGAAQLQRSLVGSVVSGGGVIEKVNDEAAFQFRFRKNHVAVMHAFPLERDRQRAAEYAAQHNALPLIVVYDSQLKPRLFHPRQPAAVAKVDIMDSFAAVGEVLPSGPSAPFAPKWVSSGPIIVSWSKDFDVVWGFSKQTGDWTRQELHAAGHEYPVVGNNVASIRVGDSFYAYSGTTGTWDVLKVDQSDAQFSVDSDVVMVHTPTQVYTFASAAGRWTSPGDPNDSAIASPTAPTTQGNLRIIELEQFTPSHAAQIIEQLFAGDVTVTVANIRSQGGTIIVRASNERVLAEITGVLEELDRGAANGDVRGSTSPAADLPAATDLRNVQPEMNYGDLANQSVEFDEIMVDVSDGTQQPKVLVRAGNSAFPFSSIEACVEWARGGVDYHEQQAAGLAGTARVLREQGRDRRDVEAQLQVEVRQAFAWRQLLQQAETEALRQRLTTIESNIQARNAIKDAIIERRVQDLLDPLRRWDNTPDGK